jgi:pyruvate dehydrogenase E2 component (dihydrolipoamide acetyltransferase)
MNTFYLPDLGEGLPDVEIVEWQVAIGDSIRKDDILVSVETAKAIIDIPSPFSGVIARLYGANGDVINTGDPLVAFDNENTTSAKSKKDKGTVVGEVESKDELIQNISSSVLPSASNLKATPAVRALAHRLNVELSMVTPSGHDGVILTDDIKRVSKILASIGPIEPLRGVRRAMARNMALSHAEVVPVTVTEDVDISALKSSSEITPRLVRAIAIACIEEPSLNTWFDSHALGRRVLKNIHLGLAIDASQGLFVAILKNIEALSLAEIKIKLFDLKLKIEKRSFKPEELRGYTITLSNYGSITGRYATPIVLPPTVAIIGAGKARKLVIAQEDEVVIKTMLPLSITIDHRVVTGGEATRFLQALMLDMQKLE